MKFLFCLPLILTACSSLPDSYPAFIAATPAEQEPAPSYIPPPNPFHTGWINTPGQAPQFYNYNDFTGTGTLYSPGTANPFTTITGN